MASEATFHRHGDPELREGEAIQAYGNDWIASPLAKLGLAMTGAGKRN
ncbi:MAG TPA: hypothetical protein VKY65_04130 [Alphaproteobacteria bacterium]|nr:hypothetical protein [Alphaproteobacteria bacterium]